MNNIILETNRLRLEKIGSNHKGELFKLLSNPKVHRYFPNALDKDESEEFYERIQTEYTTNGYCFWAVIRIIDNQFLGICGLVSQTIDGHKEVEVGYRFLDKFWGYGYGPEAAKGCIEYGRETLKLTSIISLIRPENLQSIRVAEKNKMNFEKETEFHNMRHRVYRIKLSET